MKLITALTKRVCVLCQLCNDFVNAFDWYGNFIKAISENLTPTPITEHAAPWGWVHHRKQHMENICLSIDHSCTQQMLEKGHVEWFCTAVHSCYGNIGLQVWHLSRLSNPTGWLWGSHVDEYVYCKSSFYVSRLWDEHEILCSKQPIYMIRHP